MEWSRVKSILIGVFVVVNIFLLITYVKGVRTGVSLDSKTISNTVSILRNNNIVIDEKLIPHKSEDVRIFDVRNKYDTPQNVVHQLAKNAQKAQLPYFVSGDISVSENTFSFIQTPNEQIKNLNITTAKQYVQREMKKLGALSSITYNFSTVQKGENFVVAIEPVYEGKKILDVNLYAEVSSQGIVKIFGQNWLFEDIDDGGIAPVKTVAEILINFATNRKNIADVLEITNIEIGYFLGNRSGQIITVTAVPTCKITSKNNDVYYFDLRNGDLLQ